MKAEGRVEDMQEHQQAIIYRKIKLIIFVT